MCVRAFFVSRVFSSGKRHAAADIFFFYNFSNVPINRAQAPLCGHGLLDLRVFNARTTSNNGHDTLGQRGLV